VFKSCNYTGADGVLMLSDQRDIDTALFTAYWGEETHVVGKVTNVAISVTTAVKPFYGLGSRLPTLRVGNIAIFGSVERAYINGALLNLMLGGYANGQEKAGFQIPTFNMQLNLDSLMPEGDEVSSVLTAYGVYFDTWQLAVPEDDFLLERLTFKAQRLAVADK
jgi:hypothetical protein